MSGIIPDFNEAVATVYLSLGVLFGFVVIAAGAVIEYLHDYFYRKRLKERINKEDLVNSIAYEYVKTILNPVMKHEELAKAISVEINDVLNGKYRK